MQKKPVIQFENKPDKARHAWIYKASGKLIGSPLCYEFLDEARDNITAETPHVVMDISGVTMLNSTGIGIIASLYNTTREVEGCVYLIGATDACRRPLAATHMWELLKKCDAVDELPAKL